MPTWRERIDEMLLDLQQQRDEVRVKVALGKADLKDELAELDDRFDTLKARAATWADKADDQLDDAVDSAKEKAAGWLGELKEGYQKLRSRIRDDETPPASPPA